ncbi:MAG TPA: DUF397 domain-containing protein [Actinophytocola sp.]|uniref:DUF397 domain-containing protein n=1 Tax=Actinophytocola sp. TaxID=1872138 RepID=UPI002DB89CB9|nr:DUF397 domain-containing protein [Actinophytocola sp.]HEU5475432.1 DUF397 domain-containing protein [Actinophytocola sp.]
MRNNRECCSPPWRASTTDWTRMFPTAWRKSSHSQEPQGGCVEVARTHARVAVRDSKDTSGPTLTFEPPTWHRFLRSDRTIALDRG